MTDNSADILLQSFFVGGHHGSSGIEQGCPLFAIVHPAFSLLTAVLSTLQGVLQDGFGEAVMAPDMTESCDFPALDSCQKRFLWAQKEIDLALYPVTGLVPQVGDAHTLCQTKGTEA